MFGLEFNLFNNEYFIYERLIVLIASLIPSILLLIIALYTDRKSKEPMKNILICLGSGILTIALSKYLEEYHKLFLYDYGNLIFMVKKKRNTD